MVKTKDYKALTNTMTLSAPAGSYDLINTNLIIILSESDGCTDGLTDFIGYFMLLC